MTTTPKSEPERSPAHAINHGPEHNIACTIQIPVADRDFACARHVIPHQIRMLGKHAADVLLSVNRFDKPEQPELLDGLLADLSFQFKNLRIAEVDYSPEAIRWVSETFFSGERYPMFDFKGIPIHAFLEQFRQSRHPHFFHLDCDIMFGGSGPWLDEAIALLDSDPDVLAVNPLAGPRANGPYHSDGTPYSVPHGEGFKVPTFTTRSFLVELNSFYHAMSSLPLPRPKRRNDRIFTRFAGYPMVDHLEILFQEKMLAAGQFRVDLGGSGGLWKLHPVHKTPQFLSGVESLIGRVEAGDVSAEQHGHYDVHPSMLAQTDMPTRSSRLRQLANLAKTRLFSSKARPRYFSDGT
jgi:hypothetical protein